MPEQQGTHFYFMVIQTSMGGGTQLSENFGTLTPNKDATRLDLYEAVKADAIRRNPIATNGAVIAFDIQPNKL